MSLSVGLLWAMGLVSCAFSEDPDALKKTAVSSPQQQEDVADQLRKMRADEAAAGKLTDHNVAIEFIDGAPGFYLMRVNWDVEVESVQISIGEKSRVIWSRDSKSYETTVRHSSIHDVELTAYGVLGPLSSYEKTVEAPRDYIVNAVEELKELSVIRAHRVFFTKEGLLSLNGNDLQIIAEKIYAEDKRQEGRRSIDNAHAHIMSAEVESEAEGEKGLFGSVVNIKAKEAYGTLFVGMVGMNGQNGLSGLEVEKQNGISRAIDPAKRGQDGSAAVIGWENQAPIPCFTGGIDVGLGAVCGGEPPKICKRRATNGTDGLPGAKGTNGLSGGRGGNPGTLIVDVKKSHEFSLVILQRLGKPGKGGAGADGFPGGEPGKAGTTADSRICPAARNGQPGARGPKGDDGADGAAAKSLNLDGVNVHIERTLSI
jgi:hypothetical protein